MFISLTKLAGKLVQIGENQIAEEIDHILDECNTEEEIEKRLNVIIDKLDAIDLEITKEIKHT